MISNLGGKHIILFVFVFVWNAIWTVWFPSYRSLECRFIKPQIHDSDQPTVRLLINTNTPAILTNGPSHTEIQIEIQNCRNTNTPVVHVSQMLIIQTQRYKNADMYSSHKHKYRNMQNVSNWIKLLIRVKLYRLV